MKKFNIVQKLSFLQKVLLVAFMVMATYFVMSSLMKTGFIDRYYAGIIMSCCINIILVVSLNVTTGFLGHLTLGHAGFMAIGAYTSAVVTRALAGVSSAIAFPTALIIGAIAAGFFGLIVSIPALRLKGDYLAIITLAFGEAIRNILLNLDFVGGAQGFIGIPLYTTFAWAFFLMVISVVATYFLVNSRQGRAIISIREDEIAAESTGINTNQYKMLAYVFAALFAGLAGGLYGHYIGILVPKTFSFNKSIEILVMVVLGGMGSIKGSILAAIGLTFLPELLRSAEIYRTLIYALVLIIIMLVKYNAKLNGMVMQFKQKIMKREAH